MITSPEKQTTIKGDGMMSDYYGLSLDERKFLNKLFLEHGNDERNVPGIESNRPAVYPATGRLPIYGVNILSRP